MEIPVIAYRSWKVHAAVNPILYCPVWKNEAAVIDLIFASDISFAHPNIFVPFGLLWLCMLWNKKSTVNSSGSVKHSTRYKSYCTNKGLILSYDPITKFAI